MIVARGFGGCERARKIAIVMYIWLWGVGMPLLGSVEGFTSGFCVLSFIATPLSTNAFRSIPRMRINYEFQNPMDSFDGMVRAGIFGPAQRRSGG